MFLRQFQYLVALEQDGHFGRAAERCNVSQPTLSSAVKHLEDELGVPIILRQHKFQGFTDEGRRVVEWAKRILADKDAMIDELAIMRGNLHGRLRIAAMPMSMPVTAFIDQLFFARHPAAQVDIQFLGLDEMRHGLSSFEYDVGITYLEDQPLERLKTMPLYEEPFHLMVPDAGWFPGRSSVTWAEAAEVPLCLLSPNTHERRITDRTFAAVGRTPKPRLESNAMINLAFHVTQGGFATVVPQYFMRAIGGSWRSRLLLLDEPMVAQQVGLVWLEGNPMLPMTKAVVEMMQEAVDSGSVAKALNEM